MLKMRVQDFIDGGVTLVHFLPPSMVTWIRPSPVPAHRTLTSSGEGASAVMEPRAVGVTVEPYFPAFDGMSHFSPRVRSPLMGVQLCPPLVVFQAPAVA